MLISTSCRSVRRAAGFLRAAAVTLTSPWSTASLMATTAAWTVGRMQGQYPQQPIRVYSYLQLPPLSANQSLVLPAASSTDSSLARIPPILLKAGIWIPYLSSSSFILLISSSEQSYRSAKLTVIGPNISAPTPGFLKHFSKSKPLPNLPSTNFCESQLNPN